MSDLFGELRELVHTGMDAARAHELCALIERQRELDPESYRDVWIPYLTGVGRGWDFPLTTVHGLDTLATWSTIAPFARFRLSLRTSSPRLVKERLDSRLFPRVCALHVDGRRYLHRGYTYAHKISSSRSIATLDVLHLEDVTLGHDNVAKLLDTPHLTNLRELVLESHTAGPIGAAHIATSEALPNLRTLRLSYDELDDGTALAIAASPNLPKLGHLDVSGGELTQEGIDALRGARPTLHVVHTPWSATNA